MRKIRPEEALEYHRRDGKPGKLAVQPTKPLVTQEDMSLAYTPGVAAPVQAITDMPELVYRYTAKGNLVAVITNGTAVLGLGDRGPLAAKPVMEGKAIFFKRFADIDAFDLEISAKDPDELVKIIAAIAPTFGGINLEDIKAPDCFYVEERLRRLLDIPVFHNDQHGGAIVATAGLLNGVRLTRKSLADIRLVICGAGAAGLASAELAIHVGVKRENITLVDTAGVIYRGRQHNMNPYKARYAVETTARTLADAMRGADVFYGLSVPNIVDAAMLQSMNDRPLVFALATPDPEISYELARSTRPDAIVATGRSDLPNQINNVLSFAHVFRGALDVQASAINLEMKLAAARALAELATKEVPDCVSQAYDGATLRFGPEYIIPKALDPRVPLYVAPAVAQAAMDTGVARIPVPMSRYRYDLQQRLKPNYHETHFCGECLFCKSLGIEADRVL